MPPATVHCDRLKTFLSCVARLYGWLSATIAKPSLTLNPAVQAQWSHR